MRVWSHRMKRLQAIGGANALGAQTSRAWRRRAPLAHHMNSVVTTVLTRQMHVHCDFLFGRAKHSKRSRLEQSWHCQRQVTRLLDGDERRSSALTGMCIDNIQRPRVHTGSATSHPPQTLLPGRQ